MATTNKNKSTEEKLPESQAKETTAENADNESSENSAHETAEQTPKSAAEEKEQTEGGDKSAEGVMAGKKVKLILKHKSNTLHYHRCGLTITKTFVEYEVPAEIVEKLKADKWIEVREEK